MRTNSDAFETLNANRFVPHRDLKSEVPFLILGCGGEGKGTVRISRAARGSGIEREELLFTPVPQILASDMKAELFGGLK